MGRSSRHKEKYSNELSGDSSYEGTAARTRPFSLEEIMTRRKTRKVPADTKDGAEDQDKLSKQEEVKNFSDHPEHDGGYRHSKVSADSNVKKVIEDTKKRSSRKEEATSLKGRSAVNGGDKGSRDSETKLKVKLDNEIGSIKERKSESQRHHSRRNEEHTRDDNGMRRAKERKNEDQSHRISRNDERARGDSEMGRAEERKSESHHRSRNEKRPRDDKETRKKPAEKRDVKESFLDAERLKSETESKRKHQSREKDRLETDASAIKNHDSGKHIPESVERKDRKKDSSKSHYEGSGQKRRRSRSGERRGRDRTISLSPRAQKRSYDGREDGESSLHTSKERRQHSDDRNRVSSNGGHSSSHNWRQGGRGSRLGGYSPRKRRSEAAIKTPSPTPRSPERKNAGWDLPPTGKASMPADVISDYQSINQNSSTEHKISNVVPAPPHAVGTLSRTSPSSVAKARDVPSDPIQLTQATRPTRRLYIENLPASASDKSVIEWLNNLLPSSGANHVQGTQGCINCNINKEKGQALVEFLKDEDATIALSFDGKSFTNSVLRIRRPMDLVDAATGVPEKSVPAIDPISDTVKDSPHKIFIGGISNALSSDMLMEIVSAFGHLKAYRFEVNDDLEEPCAFLEYTDQTITPKACAGLNGMKLGGQVLTVVQAVPDASLEGNTEKPFYGIPEHAKPLLSEPTKVLKLKNVFHPEEFSALSESELEETLGDVRLECARFGTVRSVNFIRGKSSSEVSEQVEEMGGLSDERALQDLKGDSSTKVTEILEQHIPHNSGENCIAGSSVNGEEPIKDGGNLNDRQNDDKPVEDLGENEMGEMYKLDSNLVTEAPTCNPSVDDNPHASHSQSNTNEDNFTTGTDIVQTQDTHMNDYMMGEEELKEEPIDGVLQEASLQLNQTAGGEAETIEKDEIKRETSEDKVFEQGCVLVEYVRAEATCAAAHGLHGRLFGERSVSVDYIPHDLYLLRFPK